MIPMWTPEWSRLPEPCVVCGASLAEVGVGHLPATSGSCQRQQTATVTARSGRSLVMAVEDADLWVRATEDESANPSERWIGLDRTDQATAAYVLQNWLAQLEDKP